LSPVKAAAGHLPSRAFPPSTNKLKSMNKADLVEFVATATKSSKSQAEEAVNAVIAGIEKGLKKDKSVQLVGFATFSVTKRAARMGINPQTKAAIKIPARNAVKFKAGSALKSAVA